MLPPPLELCLSLFKSSALSFWHSIALQSLLPTKSCLQPPDGVCSMHTFMWNMRVVLSSFQSLSAFWSSPGGGRKAFAASVSGWWSMFAATQTQLLVRKPMFPFSIPPWFILIHIPKMHRAVWPSASVSELVSSSRYVCNSSSLCATFPFSWRVAKVSSSYRWHMGLIFFHVLRPPSRRMLLLYLFIFFLAVLLVWNDLGLLLCAVAFDRVSEGIAYLPW